MNQIVPFTFESQQLRVVLDERREPWFIALDVTACLGISAEQIRRLDDDERGLRSMQTPGGSQQLAVVNEPGLYTLVLGSRKPEAKRFKRWVTHEVLPTIRKTGAYARPAPSSSIPSTFAEALYLAGQQAERIRALQEQLAAKSPPEDPGDPGRIVTHAPRRELPWLSTIRQWLAERPTKEWSADQILANALSIHEPTNIQRGAVGRCMRALGWKRGRRRGAGKLSWVYVRPGAA